MIVIFRVKVSCITSVDGTLLVVCHLSSDVVGCKDWKYDWCISVSLLLQFDGWLLLSQIVGCLVVPSLSVLLEFFTSSLYSANNKMNRIKLI